MIIAYLDGCHIGVLGNVLVLVETILGGLSFAKINAEFDKQQHHRLQRGDGAAARPLGGNMFVEDVEGSRGLAHGDKFLSPLKTNMSATISYNTLSTLSTLHPPHHTTYLENILGLDMRRRRHDRQRTPGGSTTRTRLAGGQSMVEITQQAMGNLFVPLSGRRFAQ